MVATAGARVSSSSLGALSSFVVALAALGACGGATPELAFSSADALAAAIELYGGPRAGDVELQRTVKVVVDSAVRSGDAESRLELQVAAARFTASDAPLVVRVATPPGATLTGVDARIAGRPVVALGHAHAAAAPGGPAIDPEQRAWEIRFLAPGPGEVLEAIVHFAVPGTLVSDAQPLAVAGADEILLRYDLPSDVAGSFQVVGAELKPVVTEQAGRKVIALFVKQAWQLPAGTLARYTTQYASPKGYEQRFASTWAEASADYARRLVAASDGLDGGYAAPFAPPAGGDAALACYTWVLERKLAPDGLAAPWHAARALKGPLEGNALTATDRVHLLHWLLREARVPHRFAVARPAAYPRLAPGFPVPGAFDVPLIRVGERWLDPGCDTCAAGEVRAALVGGQALLLPVPDAGAELLDLEPPPASPTTP